MTSLDRDEARDLCRLTLAGAPTRQRSLLVEVDARGAHLIAAAGTEPVAIWTLGLDSLGLRGLDGLEEDRAFADALATARLGLLKMWFQRGLVILGLSDGSPLARRRQGSLVRALKDFLCDDEQTALAA